MMLISGRTAEGIVLTLCFNLAVPDCRGQGAVQADPARRSRQDLVLARFREWLTRSRSDEGQA